MAPVASTPDENFLQISYSTDGTTWIPIQKVNEANWKDLTITIPVNDWVDLSKLQVRIASIQTSLQVVPPVYLDGMMVEVHYLVGPMENGGGASPSGNVPAGSPSAAPVVVTHATLAPVNGKTNFGADEAPTFEYNLNNLPASAPTSGPPQSFNDRRGGGTLSWRDFFYSLLGGLGVRADAQTISVPTPTPGNPVVAEIDDPSGRPTGFQPVIATVNNQLNVGLPEPATAFRPGRYTLKLWILHNGIVYATENTFTWGVLAVNFDKSLYALDDTAHIGFGVLDDAGNTLCGAPISMTVTDPGGVVHQFSTANGSIVQNPTCGPATVTNAPDYAASMALRVVGTYQVSVTALTPDGTRTVNDQFGVQDPPLFDVTRNAPTRIYPPVPYGVSITVEANADYHGAITETVPASFGITGGNFSSQSSNGTNAILSWTVKLNKGDAMTLRYAFKAPNVSPELYKLGPLQIGTWTETRQWQIAADAIATKQIFLTDTASTTWTVPSDWNSASNTIEVIGGGAGGGVGGTAQGAGGGGGGGGAYAKITNFAAAGGASVKIQIGAAGGSAANGTVTYLGWNGSGATTTCSATTMAVCSMFGSAGGSAVGTTAGTAGTGGLTTGSTGSSTYAGGSGGVGGGTGASNSGAGGGGGGGAGLNAAGTAGSAGVTTAGGAGGQGDGTFGGVGGPAGTAGSNGTEWSTSPAYGSGGGGGGAAGGGHASAGVAGSPGGTYGSGGGGGSGVGKGGSGSGGAGGAGTQGIIIITYTQAGVLIGDGTSPAPFTIAPGANATTSDAFTFATNVGTTTITSVTTTLSAVTGVGLVEIANSNGTTIYGSSTNLVATTTAFASTTFTIPVSGMNLSTTTTTFTVLVQPKNATSMPAIPGGTYIVTSTVTGWIDSKGLATGGANTTSSIITIDNQSPGDVMNPSIVAGNGSATLNWINPSDADFAGVVVLRSTSSIQAVSMVTYPGTGLGPMGIAFDGTNMWTANYSSSSVTKVTPTGGMTTYAGTGAGPKAIVFDHTNMWTANYGSNSVTEISPTGTMTTYPGTGIGPQGIAFDGTNIWTANVMSNSVTKIGMTSVVPNRPVEGTSYSPGQTIGSSVVACVTTNATSSCFDTGLTNGTKYYYEIFAFDTHGNYSLGTVPPGSPVTPSSGGVPVVSNVVMNGGSAITLVPNSTQSVSVTASTTDSAGPADILYATSTIYRSGVGANCAASSLDCYTLASSSCAFSGSSSTVTCTANIAYIAQPTDTSTYAGQSWMAAVTVAGGGGQGNAATASGVTLNTLLALNVTTSSVNYGLVAANGASGNQTTTIQNVGNAPISLALSGTSPALSGNPSITIPVTAEQYSTTTFAWGAAAQLGISTSTVPGFSLSAPTSTTSTVQGNIYWAIGGFIAPTGTYTGTISFTASP